MTIVSDYIDLYELNLKNEPSYDWRDGSMHRQEKLIKEELEGMGYTVGRWECGERDSFGPLSRIVSVTTPKGEHKVVIYL